jgi:competence protein ComEC
VQGAETATRIADAGSVPALAPLRPVLPQALPSSRPTVRRLSLADAETARRTFVLLPFAMIAGLAAYAALPFEPQGWALSAVGILLAVVLVALRHSAILPLIWLPAAAWLGFCLLPIHATWSGTAMLARSAYGEYQAKVVEVISATPESRRIIVSTLTPVGDSRPVAIRGARLVVPAQPAVEPGDTIEASLRLAPVPGPILPGTFDSQFHAYFAGVGAYGNVTGAFAVVAEGGGFNLDRSIEGMRRMIGGRIAAVLQGPSAAIGQAMVVGDQSAIDDATREVMAASGLAHIYSISGLHLSIVAGGVFFLLRLAMASVPLLALRWPVKKVAALGGLAAALGYLLLAGGLANVPALRSTIMLGLIFGAILAGRRALTIRNVALAAIVIILIDPASVFRASFQLSFAAVVALIGIYEMPRRVPATDRSGVGRLWNALVTTASTSLIAGTATLLFSAYHFQQTAPLGVVGNVLVLPVVSLVIMPFAVLSVLAMPFGAEAPLVLAMGWGIDRMLECAILVANWSEGWTGNPLLTGSALLIGLVALAWFAFLKSWWRLAGPAIAVPLIILFGLDARPDVLIADSTQAVAVRAAGEWGLVTGKPGSFAVDVWGEHYQEEIAPRLSAARCDELGCIVRTDKFSIAVVNNAAAFAEDCGQHNLIVTRARAPSTCRSDLIIDSDALASGGVHWLRWNESAGRFDIRAAIAHLNRPWRVAPP